MQGRLVMMPSFSQVLDHQLIFHIMYGLEQFYHWQNKGEERRGKIWQKKQQLLSKHRATADGKNSQKLELQLQAIKHNHITLVPCITERETSRIEKFRKEIAAGLASRKQQQANTARVCKTQWLPKNNAALRQLKAY